VIGQAAVRPARPADLAAMLGLINGYAKLDRMLPRDRAFLEGALGDFAVAEGPAGVPADGPAEILADGPANGPADGPADGRPAAAFLGCCALATLTPELGEIRSLAVVPAAAGRGIGRDLVHACVAAARERGLRRVFALTLVPDFFVKCGFTRSSLARLPEKSAEECPVCPKRFACDEEAMLLHLDGSRPAPLAAGDPIGYTRMMRPEIAR